MGFRAFFAVMAIALSTAGCVPQVQPSRDFVGVAVLANEVVITRDGVRLPLRVWQAEGEERAVAVALHGFNDYSNAWSKPAAFWASRGVTTYAYDQRGFGDTTHRGIWAGVDVLMRDLIEVVRLVHARHPDRPLYVIGESMGGAVAMASLARAGSGLPVDGLVLSAPAVWGRETMSPFYRIALWLAAYTMPSNRLSGSGLKIQASDNIEMLRGLGRDPLVIKETRTDTVYGLVNMMDAGLQAADKLRLPVLVLYGANDQIVPRSPIEMMLERMRAPHRTVYYPDGWHMLFRDLQGGVVWRDVLSWMVDRSAPMPSGHEVVAAVQVSGG